MAKLTTSFPVKSISGKIEKDSNFVTRTRFNRTEGYILNMPQFSPSQNQLSHQQLVKQANQLVSDDFKNPERKLYWQQIANAPNSTYKTPRGAAFSHFLALLKQNNSK